MSRVRWQSTFSTWEISVNIPGFSTNGLLMMLSGIRDALEVDDNTPDRTDKPYGVRAFKDWRLLWVGVTA